MILGTVAGPIIAVLATRLLDIWRARSERRTQIFTSLMVTRRSQLTGPHVEALNHIEIEFSRDAPVMTAFNAYMAILSEPQPKGELFDHWLQKKNRAFATLVHSLAKRLRHPLDKLDFMEGGYYPKGWVEDEQTARDNMRLTRLLLQQLLTANPRYVFHVKNVDQQGGGSGKAPIERPPFPPPPEGD
jgi:hypothetical protein